VSYKTILVHCNDRRRIEALLAPVVGLADRFGSHVLGLSVVPPVAIVPAAPALGPPIVVDAHCELYRAENPAMRAAFEGVTRGRSFVAEWRDDDAGAFGVADCVLPYAHAVDLVVASQTDREWPGSGWLDITDRLAMESGRPVLIVPNAGAHQGIGERVLVAWNGRHEAARAVFDALPILRGANEVKIVWVNPESERELAQGVLALDICAALVRHGVKCKATEQSAPHGSVGETLIASAEEMSADLLVMGCYGHARVREFVFGGASRHVLAHMRTPILMSH
jgi:nucleotide-binding universal stress UspA family protein